jgi:hypothetical protein
MTNEEKALLAKLGEVYNQFQALPILHGADLPEFAMHLHALQNIVLARVALRQRGGIV